MAKITYEFCVEYPFGYYPEHDYKITKKVGYSDGSEAGFGGRSLFWYRKTELACKRLKKKIQSLKLRHLKYVINKLEE